MIKENIDGTLVFESVNLCQTKCEIALDLWKLPQMYIYNFKILRQEISTIMSFPLRNSYIQFTHKTKVCLQRQLL